MLAALMAGCGGADHEQKTAPPAPDPVTLQPDGSYHVALDGTDTRKYSVERFEIPAGARVTLALTNVGTMPREQMAHNWVLLTPEAPVMAFVAAAGAAGESDYFPEGFEEAVIAHTDMAGPGQTVRVTFTAPDATGEYPYVCTFPAHYADGMRGVMVVTGKDGTAPQQ